MSGARGTPSRSSSFATFVYWDFENSWVPDNYDLRTLKTKVEAAIKKYNSNFFISGNLNAIGPGRGSYYEQIRQVSDITFIPIPEKKMVCDTFSCENVVVGRNLREEQVMRKTDVADKIMIIEMFMRAIENVHSKILVISGDLDFLSTIEALMDENVFVMVALALNSNLSLTTRPKAVWLWKSTDDDDHRETMIKGGGPIYKDA